MRTRTRMTKTDGRGSYHHRISPRCPHLLLASMFSPGCGLFILFSSLVSRRSSPLLIPLFSSSPLTLFSCWLVFSFIPASLFLVLLY